MQLARWQVSLASHKFLWCWIQYSKVQVSAISGKISRTSVLRPQVYQMQLHWNDPLHSFASFRFCLIQNFITFLSTTAGYRGRRWKWVYVSSLLLILKDSSLIIAVSKYETKSCCTRLPQARCLQTCSYQVLEISCCNGSFLGEWFLSWMVVVGHIVSRSW